MAVKWWVAGILAFSLLAVLVMVYRYAMAGPTFRAQDYASYEECIAAIPREWRPGSLERSGAETTCAYVHGER